ncbi:hypothetical protein JW992_06575 [candidate division KSB1 bacterium]|nr:hypothetical protein [candidate division KSB1 bacterium]
MRIVPRVRAAIGLIAAIFSTACRTDKKPLDTPLPPVPPVYVTVALHIEDTPVYANCQVYPEFRQKLVQFAETIAPFAAAVNLQTDYEFLMGVARCETPELLAVTDGKNVLDYLAATYGYEIDAHQEGGWDIQGRDNYADIRYLAGQVTAAISETAGGLVWDDPAQWATLTQGERALLTPDYIWTPQVLTLAVGSQHHLGDFSADDYASGVWRPKGAGTDFWVHDPQGPLVYIGPGEYDNWGNKWGLRSTAEFVNDLLDQLQAGTLDRQVMYTASIAVPQSIIFDAKEHAKLLAVFETLEPRVASGQIVYVTYAQAVHIWQSEYGAKANLYRQH